MKPRLGFLGLGWIGQHRMEAILEHGAATVAAVADPSRERRAAAQAIAPDAITCDHLGQLLELPLEGIVIATPSALHAEQCIGALQRGVAVFCQKPIGRTAAETRRVVGAARAANRLLGVDLSYRHTEAMQRIRRRMCELGRVFAIDLVFHHAYAPDSPWFYDKEAAGGGCVMDLGINLVDLALWLLGYPRIDQVTSQLFAGGEPLRPDSPSVEDYAVAQLTAGGVTIRLACSWRAHAGRDAVIEATVHGTHGGLALRNLGGSLHDLIGERYASTRTERLTSPPEAWEGRAAIRWAEQLASGGTFDREAEHLVDVAAAIDNIYGRPRS